MSTVQMEGLWQFIQTLTLNSRNRQWLAEKLIEPARPVSEPTGYEQAWLDVENGRISQAFEKKEDLFQHLGI